MFSAMLSFTIFALCVAGVLSMVILAMVLADLAKIRISAPDSILTWVLCAYGIACAVFVAGGAICIPIGILTIIFG